MKKIILPILVTAVTAMAVVSCGKDKPVTSEKQEVTTTQDGAHFVLDSLNSKVEWKGFKVVKTDNSSHFGTLKFESGDITIKDGKLESGKFVVDMNSLEAIDLKDNAELKAKLEGHLKHADFFETEKFPTASFEITKVSDAPEGGDFNTILDGNLTIKGITKPAQFKANVVVANGEVSIATEAKDIDRSEFGVKFQMPLAEGIIKNDINVQILVKALEQK